MIPIPQLPGFGGLATALVSESVLAHPIMLTYVQPESSPSSIQPSSLTFSVRASP